MLAHVVSKSNIWMNVRLTLQHLYTMNSKEVLRRLENRAIEAQRLIKSLKSQISVLSQANYGVSVDQECKDIIMENEKLEKEIEFYKKKLTAAEADNGKKVLGNISLTGSTAEKSVLNNKCDELRLNDEKSRKISLDAKNVASSKKSLAHQEEPPKRKSTDKKPKPEGKKDAVTKKPDDEIDVGRLDIRIGRVVDVKKHPDADTLYVESVELREEKERTVVSGLVRFVERQELEGRLVVVLCNLKPVKMRGVTSEGMLLCASSPEKVEVLNPPPGSAPGDVVICEGFEHRPDSVMNPKKKIWETVAADLKVNSSGVATYKGTPLSVSGKGEIRSTALTDVPIK